MTTLKEQIAELEKVYTRNPITHLEFTLTGENLYTPELYLSAPQMMQIIRKQQELLEKCKEDSAYYSKRSNYWGCLGLHSNVEVRALHTLAELEKELGK